jgi:hypothetical protein
MRGDLSVRAARYRSNVTSPAPNGTMALSPIPKPRQLDMSPMTPTTNRATPKAANTIVSARYPTAAAVRPVGRVAFPVALLMALTLSRTTVTGPRRVV